MKKINQFLLLSLLFSMMTLHAQDVSLKLTESALSNLVNAMAKAKVFAYGHSGSSPITFYDVYPNSASIDIQPNNRFVISANVTAHANINLGNIYSFDYTAENKTISISGVISLLSNGSGFKIKFTPDPNGVNIDDGNSWFEQQLENAANGFAANAPEISTTVSANYFLNTVTQYFTSATPTLTTTNDEIILSYTLTAGPRYITAYNEVNQKNTVGSIDEINIANGSVISTASSPRIFEWNTGTQHQLQTPLALLDDLNGKNKYKQWVSNRTGIQTDVALRRIQLTVSSSDEDFGASFPPAQRVQLSNLLEGGYSGGTVSYTSNGVTTTGATFDDYDYLNQTGTANTAVPNGIEGYNWCFTNWSDGNTSQSRNIVVSSDVNLVANYKKHLLSSSANALANNNQRKIAQDDNGMYYLVYEKDNKIWFSKSSDGLNYWSNEVEVTAGLYDYSIYKSPSLVASGSIVAVVWQGINETSGGFNGSNIYVRFYNNATNAWSNIEMLPWFEPSYNGYDATPVVSGDGINGDGDHTVVAWSEPGGIAVATKYNNTWSSVTYVPNTNGFCVRPSLAHYYYTYYALVWEDQNAQKISYIEPYILSGSIQFQNPAQVSPSDWMNNQRPTIAVTNDTRRVVVWQSYDNVVEGTSVHVREKTSNGWSGIITSFSTNSASAPLPVVGSYSYNNKYTVAWEIDGTIYSAKYNGLSWLSSTMVASNSSGGTMLATIDKTTSTLIGLWKKPNTSFALTSSGFHQTSGQQQQKSENSQLTFVSYRLNKHTLINLESDTLLAAKGYKGMIAFEIAGLSRQTSSATSEIEVGKENRRLKSDKITVASNTEALKFAGAYYAKGLTIPKGARLNELNTLVTLQLKDANTDEVVKEIWTVPFSRLASATTTDGEYRTMNISLNGLKGREVYLEVTTPSHIEPVFVDDYYMYKGDDLKMKKFFAEPAFMPTEYALHQNYPNPFNPSTTIRFDLVEPQYVTLKVYNSLGQQVKELVNEYYSAGSHEVTLNASSLSSGAYFYRMTAGKFTAVKSFVLVK